MLQLLNPIWLYSLAALAIPVFIHLWNVRPGKTLKVGSIALLGETTSKTARSFKLADLVLLALRCLLLILLALLLSEPVWHTQKSYNKAKGWLLIQKEQMPEAYAQFKPSIDSAIQDGYEFHYFTPGFPDADLKKILKDSSIKAEKNSNAPSISYWSLLNALNQRLPSNFNVLLISDNRLSKFSGKRPELSYRLNWRLFNSPDSTATWINNAYFAPSDSLKIILAKSTPTVTSFTPYTTNPAERNSQFQMHIVDGKPIVKLANTAGQDTSETAIDSSTLKIAIYSDKYPHDATYLKAAIGAIQKFTDRKIDLKTSTNGNILLGSNFAFWLSDKPMSKLPAGVTALKYETGKQQEINSWIELGQGTATKKTQLFKRMPNTDLIGTTTWEDGFGTPLLAKENQVYHFYSHFDPEWNSLVWSEDFPKLIMPLLLGEPKQAGESLDRRTVDTDQIMPQFANVKSPSAIQNHIESDLQHGFWVALFIILAAERWLSHKQKSTRNV